MLPSMLAAGTGTLLYTTGASSVTPAPVFVSAGMAGAALRKWALTLNGALAGKGVYAKLGNKDTIYIVGAGVLEGIKKEVRDTTVFNFKTDDVTAVKLTGWKGTLGSPSTLSLEKKDGKWAVASNSALKPNIDPDKVSTMLNNLSNLKAEKFVTSAKGFFWTAGGFEYSLLLLLVALYFLIRGGGACSLDGKIGRAEWLKLARKHRVPTLLDAAADVPPLENLAGYSRLGFDLVAFSGGKALRGPNDTGLLLGRRELIEAAKRNTNPHCGTVGRALPLTEIKIGEEKEILAKGPQVFRGYRNRAEDTRESLDDDGWFHTGDLGELDDDGFLRITGRMKEIIVTSSGKNITPSNIENRLTDHPKIEHAVVFGDDRPYLVALLVPDGDLDEDEAQKVIDEANQEFAKIEQIKKFTIADRELSQDDGELTTQAYA